MWYYMLNTAPRGKINSNVLTSRDNLQRKALWRNQWLRLMQFATQPDAGTIRLNDKPNFGRKGKTLHHCTLCRSESPINSVLPAPTHPQTPPPKQNKTKKWRVNWKVPSQTTSRCQVTNKPMKMDCRSPKILSRKVCLTAVTLHVYCMI